MIGSAYAVLFEVDNLAREALGRGIISTLTSLYELVQVSCFYYQKYFSYFTEQVILTKWLTTLSLPSQ
jgi:hypothetical protein